MREICITDFIVLPFLRISLNLFALQIFMIYGLKIDYF